MRRHPADNHDRRDRSAPGFTLIEILIAILILGVVLGTIYAAYTGTFRLTQTVQQDDDLYAAARAFFMRMAKDMGGLVPYREGYEFVAKSYDAKGRDFMRLSFRSSSHLAFAEGDIPGGIARIAYEIVEDKNEEGFRLLRQDILMDETANHPTPLMTDNQEGLRQKSFILCHRIHSLVYRFYDAQGREYETWDSGSEVAGQKKRAPSMILIRLNLINPADKERPLHYMTRIAIPMYKVDREDASS